MSGGDRVDPPGDSSSAPLGEQQVRRRIETIWRLDAGRIVAALARWTGDFQRAEDAAQDALIAALEHWPTRGAPEHPTAWLLRAARNRAIDHLRREQRGDALIGDYGSEIARSHLARTTPQFSDNARHDALALLFIACHPILSADTRCALALRIIGGLDNAALARAFLVPEATIAQRIVRGKRKLAEANIRFEMPSEVECRERLGSVREVIYLIFTEGHVASQGGDWMRPDLCHVALRMARVLTQAAADDAETQALLALIELHGARLAARSGPRPYPVFASGTHGGQHLNEAAVYSFRRPGGPTAPSACRLRVTRHRRSRRRSRAVLRAFSPRAVGRRFPLPVGARPRSPARQDDNKGSTAYFLVDMCTVIPYITEYAKSQRSPQRVETTSRR